MITLKLRDIQSNEIDILSYASLFDDYIDFTNQIRLLDWFYELAHGVGVQ